VFWVVLGLAGLPNFFISFVLDTQKTSNEAILHLYYFAFSSIFRFFAPFWSGLDKKMAVELRFEKPIADYQ